MGRRRTPPCPSRRNSPARSMGSTQRPNIRDVSRKVARGSSPKPVATSQVQRIEEAEFGVVQNPPFLGYTRRTETAGL